MCLSHIFLFLSASICDYWRNLGENYFARVAVSFGYGLAALELPIFCFVK